MSDSNDKLGVNPTPKDYLDSVDVIIPALDEEASLPLVLGDLPPVRNVYVVNNGSVDATAEVALKLGATVVAEPEKGYGAACLKGIDAIQKQSQIGIPLPEAVAFVDADYSDHPEKLVDLIAPIFEDRADLVLGSRILGDREPGAMPPQSVYGNQFACFLMRILFGVCYTDLGPFRAIRFRDLCALDMSDTNFGWTIEMQIKAARSKLRILEIPVPYRKRVGRSKISGTVSGTIKAGYKILATIAKYGLARNDKHPSDTRLVAKHAGGPNRGT